MRETLIYYRRHEKKPFAASCDVVIQSLLILKNSRLLPATCFTSLAVAMTFIDLIRGSLITICHISGKITTTTTSFKRETGF